MQHASTERSILREMVAIGFLVMLVVGLAMYRVLDVVFSRSLTTQLAVEGETMLSALAEELQPHIWNMDDATIRDYMQHQVHWPSIVSFRADSEFGDPIFSIRFRAEERVLTLSRDVMRQGKRIGTLTIGLSRTGLVLVQRAIAYACVLTVLGGFTIVLAIMQIVQRRVIGRGLDVLLAGMQRIADGNAPERLPASRYREINRLVQQVNRMAAQIEERTTGLTNEISRRIHIERALRELTESLEDQVAARTQELREANRRLEDEVSERRKAEAEILLVSAREQRRIGQDLHDGLGQQLVGLSLMSKTLANRIREETPAASEQADRIAELLSQSASQSRQLAHGLYPIGVLDGGIGDTLREIGNSVTDLFGVDCTVECNNTIHPDPDVTTHLCRIIQEATNNARRHGRARRIHITLHRRGQYGELIISDDGVGMENTPRSGDGIGLRIMRYRANAIAGALSIGPNAAGGTRVAVTFPLPG